MKVPFSIVGLCLAGLVAAGVMVAQSPSPAPKAGDALMKMRVMDGAQQVRNVYIPLTPNAAIGWDSTGTPAALPMPTPFRIPTGTPNASTPGTDGDMMQDSKYLYTFLAGSWSKSPRLNLTPQ